MRSVGMFLLYHIIQSGFVAAYFLSPWLACSVLPIVLVCPHFCDMLLSYKCSQVFFVHLNSLAKVTFFLIWFPNNAIGTLTFSMFSYITSKHHTNMYWGKDYCEKHFLFHVLYYIVFLWKTNVILGWSPEWLNATPEQWRQSKSESQN